MQKYFTIIHYGSQLKSGKIQLGIRGGDRKEIVKIVSSFDFRIRVL